MTEVSQEYVDWMAMRGGPYPAPNNLEEWKHVTEHVAELRNSQVQETPQLIHNLSTRTIKIPVTADDDKLCLDGPPSAWTSSIRARVYTPKPEIGPYPLIVFLKPDPVSGDLETEDATCRLLTTLAGCVVLSVDYRNAPEHPYPTPLQDSWDAVNWAAQNAQLLLNADLQNRGFLIGGSSTGAMLAAIIAIRARDEKLEPPLTGQILRSPLTIHPLAAVKSGIQHKSPVDLEGPFFTEKILGEIFAAYKVPEPETTSPNASPLLASSFSNLPPAYIQLPDWSLSFEEGTKYAEKLEQAKVRVRTDVYKGQPHLFWMIPRMKGAADASRDLVMGVRWLEAESKVLMWDTGIREDEIETWVRDGRKTEGKEAWRQKKLCTHEKCGCLL